MTVDDRTLTIAELRADDPAAVTASYEIAAAIRATDDRDLPPILRDEFELELRVPSPGRLKLHFLAYADGEPVGRSEVELTQLDNLETAFVAVQVAPRARRRGIGRALFEHAVDVTRANGRIRIMGHGPDRLSEDEGAQRPGAAFARAMGMQAALGEVRRRLDLSTVDFAEHDRLLAEAWPRAEGYSLVQWIDRTPDEVIEDIAALDSSFLDEAPKGELELEAEKVDAERLRQQEATRAARRLHTYHSALRHDASGRVVAWTVFVAKPTAPWHAWQMITLVHPAHRGRRLGMIAKLENLRLLRAERPEVRMIDTFNAAVNTHMIAINEAMGFRPVETLVNWQLAV